MDYGGIVRRAIDIAWRNRWLWLLAFLAGESSSAGSSFNYRVPASGTSGSESSPGTPVTPGSVALVGDWIAAHLALLVAVAAAAVVLAVVWFILSAIAEGAAIRGVAEVDAERECGLGRSWSFGRLVFGPMVRLRLLILVVTVAVVVAVLALLGGAIVAFVGHQVGLGVLLGWQWVGMLLILLVAALVVPTLLKLAARAIALEGADATGSLLAAASLLRRRLGPVALLWVIELACTIGLGLAFLAVTVALGLPAVVAGIAAVQTHAYPALVLVGVYVLVLAAALIVAGAAVAAFFSAYWTLGYRRLVALA